MTAEPTSDEMAVPLLSSDVEQVASRARPSAPPPVWIRVRPPKPTRYLIDRPRLVDRISSALDDSPLVLLSAPAGYGKTVVVAEWARRSAPRVPVAWLSLTERDSEPSAFWSHLLSAFAVVGAIASDLPGRVLAADFDFDALGDHIVGDSAVVVLDGADRVQSRTVFAELAGALECAGGRLRIIMTTRADPPLPLHRYRLDGTVSEIRYHELAFSDTESSAALKAHGVSGSTGPILRALEYLEGWPAGVRMAALDLQHDPSGSRLGESSADYLEAEVLDGLAEPDREFLLRLSVVDELPPKLAPTLTDRLEADELLRQMSVGNAFVQLLPDRPGYRIHPELRRVLAIREGQHDPSAITELHGRAADWYAAQGDLRRAVEHATTIGDWQRAAGFVIEGDAVAHLVLRSPSGSDLAACLAAMPDLDEPDVQLVHAAIAVGERRLASARAALSRYEAEGTGRRERGMVAAVVRTRLCDRAEEVDTTLQAAARAWELMPRPTDRSEVRTDRLQALLFDSEGSARLRAGHLDDACAVLRRGAVAAARAGDDDLQRHCLAVLALAEAGRGGLSAVQVLIDDIERIGHLPAAAHLARAWVALEQQDLGQGRDALNAAAQHRASVDDVLIGSVSTLLRARLLRDRGDVAGARHLLVGRDLSKDWLGSLVCGEAAAVGIPVDVPGVRSSPTTASELVQAALALAQASSCAGDLAGARSALAEALSLAQADRLRRPFVHLAAETRALLRNDRALQANARWLKPDPADAPTPSGAASHPERPQTLSQRELEVLRHLGDLLTTEEIAAQLFISVNTVRTHVRRILEKFGVSRRYEAIRRARELGLL